MIAFAPSGDMQYSYTRRSVLILLAHYVELADGRFMLHGTDDQDRIESLPRRGRRPLPSGGFEAHIAAKADLDSALLYLAPLERTAIAGVCIFGLSYSHLAQLCRCPRSTLWAAFWRGIDAMVRQLNGDGGGEATGREVLDA